MISRALNNGGFSLWIRRLIVKEFKIQSNVYDASFGLASGTVMDLITNSGGDQSTALPGNMPATAPWMRAATLL